MLSRINRYEYGIMLVALVFIYLAIKESSIPLNDSLTDSALASLFLISDQSGLIFNVSCGAIATFIFWLIDIFIPRHQEIKRARYYLPKWKLYLSQHATQLDSMLKKMGEGEEGGKTRIVMGNTSGIGDSHDFGMQFTSLPSSKALFSLNAINTVISDIRNYEHALNEDELELIHELHMRLIMYISFLAQKNEIGSNKDFSDLKLIRSNLKGLLKINLFQSVG
ncbi:hypothetical protein B0W48_13655 [Pseudoalteromonas aliena]|uniref:Uncharacterized protein n=1 Tax=Pseudoalteromonas aliena TaxID=247523 RepID=A0A1Q2H086_9GAMM|nr:hypothetical protein [Pseudoalteromonas aliena]AQP98863.1 hypothetical protein B0W48_03050 [Pseudoalteromonas aliena]AQQ00763.1 hypothetical protein B0W48_13655 [Pseudoalteromonas aliena]